MKQFWLLNVSSCKMYANGFWQQIYFFDYENKTLNKCAEIPKSYPLMKRTNKIFSVSNSNLSNLSNYTQKTLIAANVLHLVLRINKLNENAYEYSCQLVVLNVAVYPSKKVGGTRNAFSVRKNRFWPQIGFAGMYALSMGFNYIRMNKLDRWKSSKCAVHQLNRIIPSYIPKPNHPFKMY